MIYFGIYDGQRVKNVDKDLTDSLLLSCYSAGAPQFTSQHLQQNKKHATCLNTALHRDNCYCRGRGFTSSAGPYSSQEKGFWVCACVWMCVCERESWIHLYSLYRAQTYLFQILMYYTKDTTYNQLSPQMGFIQTTHATWKYRTLQLTPNQFLSEIFFPPENRGITPWETNRCKMMDVLMQLKWLTTGLCWILDDGVVLLSVYAKVCVEGFRRFSKIMFTQVEYFNIFSQQSAQEI